MIEFLKSALPQHYGLHRKVTAVPAEITKEAAFDVADAAGSFVMETGKGNVSFVNGSLCEVEIISYEKYIQGFAGTSFEKGRRRCDFLIHDCDGKRFILLNEQTSTLGTVDNLSIPILGKDKNVVFPGGKYEKAEFQLAESLSTLIAVEEIGDYFEAKQRKVCLMSYVIEKPAHEVSRARTAFGSRYREIEARETGENGALLQQLAINAMGFEYRRISHHYSFRLS